MVLALAAAGISNASIPDGGGVIHGCYANASGALRVIDTATGKPCPTGTTGLNWNQLGPAGPAGQRGATGARGAQGIQGPQGPAGISQGLSGTSSNAATLQSGSLTTVMSTPAAVTSGTYFVNATARMWLSSGDYVACRLAVSGSPQVNVSELGPYPNSMFQTLSLTDSVHLSAGATISVVCSDGNSDPHTTVDNVELNAALISNAVS